MCTVEYTTHRKFFYKLEARGNPNVSLEEVREFVMPHALLSIAPHSGRTESILGPP